MIERSLRALAGGAAGRFKIPIRDASLRIGYWHCGENPNNAVEKAAEGTSQFSNFTFTDDDGR